MYSLRAATEADLSFLFEIHRLAMSDYVDAVWGWNEENQVRRFQDYFRRAHLQVITVDSTDIGFLEVIESEDGFFVSNIELVPAYQGRGIGTAIMESVVAEARCKALPVKLQVLKVNQGANRLYRRLGFIVWSETPTHYRMKLETAADSASHANG